LIYREVLRCIQLFSRLRMHVFKHCCQSLVSGVSTSLENLIVTPSESLAGFTVSLKILSGSLGQPSKKAPRTYSGDESLRTRTSFNLSLT
jgi:hypothetical protein